MIRSDLEGRPAAQQGLQRRVSHHPGGSAPYQNPLLSRLRFDLGSWK